MKMIEIIFLDIGGGILFLKSLFKTVRKNKFPTRKIAEQVWLVFLQSIIIVSLSGFFVGAIMTIQFTIQSKDFGALGFLGGLATSGTIREVGPLLIAFMLSGRIGAYTSAEIGTMKVTEQIDAIRSLGIDPVYEIIVPRFFGIIISSIFLLTYGIFLSIAGGLLTGIFYSNITFEEYLRHIPTIVKMSSIFSGLFKAFIFSIIIASICTYKGYTTNGGARGVGRSVVNTAVATMFGIVIFDWITSLIFNSILQIFSG
jgi:phospholipid/cholesterol/gamma-HCH transport system permease protein